MTRDDIIRTMRELIGPESESWSINEVMLEEWMPFLLAIAVAEREACAKVCEERMTYWHRGDPNIYEDEMCAAAIRARGIQ